MSLLSDWVGDMRGQRQRPCSFTVGGTTAVPALPRKLPVCEREPANRAMLRR
jgi:hypothetical protein